MKNSGFLLVFVLVLSACGPATTPAPTPDIQGTVSAMAGTMMAATLTAQPSSTPVPTQTPSPTASISPTETPTVDLTNVPALSVTPLPGKTATPWSGAFAPGNSEGLPTGYLLIVNNTGQPEITVTLNGTTLLRQQPIYYAYKVTNSLLITILQANYQYVVQIPNKRIMTGSFTQQTKDKTLMRVDLTKVVISGP